MRDGSANGLKAWAKQYEETPFFFEEISEYGKRLVAWSEEPEQVKKAFYAIVDQLPQSVDVLLKIFIDKTPEGEPKWSRFHGVVDRELLAHVLEQNEIYVFTDGMHQLCLKDPESDRYLAFDEHGIFFLYSPTADDGERFHSLGFEPRCAKLLYSVPHYQITPPNSEALEMNFVTGLGLEKVMPESN